MVDTFRLPFSGSTPSLFNFRRATYAHEKQGRSSSYPLPESGLLPTGSFEVRRNLRPSRPVYMFRLVNLLFRNSFTTSLSLRIVSLLASGPLHSIVSST